MGLHYETGCDVQAEAPLTYCYCCQTEIFRYDSVVDVGGALVHTDCLLPSEQDQYLSMPAIAFFCEEGGL